MRFDRTKDVLFLIDLQDPFINSIENGSAVLARAEFVVQSAQVLGVPVLSTEQVPEKLGSLCGSLKEIMGNQPIYAKATFSSVGIREVQQRLQVLGRKNAVLVGVETHICVTQTGLDLLDEGFTVAVCPDAVGATSMEKHKLGMERLRDSGIMPVHTESLVYEWLGSSEHPSFRDVLKLVKKYASG